MKKLLRSLTVMTMGAVVPCLTAWAIASSSQRIGDSAITEGSQKVTQAGPMSEKQREHSKLYKEYKPDGNLRVRAKSSAADVEVVNGTPQRIFSSNSPPFNFEDFLRNMACESDAVVIGVIGEKHSFLTEDENFVFSDYELNVEEILKNNSALPIRGKSVTVTRPGGVVMLAGRTVRAIDESLEPLALGSRYLLFLKFIPSTGAYKAFNSKGSFLLNGNRIVKLTHEDLPFEMETGSETESLIAQIRHAVQ